MSTTSTHHDTDWPAVRRKTAAMVEQAKANGTHGPTQRVCGGCRQWVDGIFHRTLDGTDLCVRCTFERETPRYAMQAAVVLAAAGDAEAKAYVTRHRVY